MGRNVAEGECALSLEAPARRALPQAVERQAARALQFLLSMAHVPFDRFAVVLAVAVLVAARVAGAQPFPDAPYTSSQADAMFTGACLDEQHQTEFFTGTTAIAIAMDRGTGACDFVGDASSVTVTTFGSNSLHAIVDNGAFGSDGIATGSSIYLDSLFLGGCQGEGEVHFQLGLSGTASPPDWAQASLSFSMGSSADNLSTLWSANENDLGITDDLFVDLPCNAFYYVESRAGVNVATAQQLGVERAEANLSNTFGLTIVSIPEGTTLSTGSGFRYGLPEPNGGLLIAAALSTLGLLGGIRTKRGPSA